MVVARTGNVESATLLLAAGADVNAKEEWGGQSALMWAAAQSQPEMVKFLVANGADPDARGLERDWQRRILTEPRPKDMNRGGFTPLLYAAREGCIECARNLVEGGADIDLTDPERVTSLALAINNLHFDLAAYLIEAGADVDKWDLFGRTPLYQAVDMNTLPTQGSGSMSAIPSMDKHTGLDVARLLLDKGANPNIQLKRRPPYRNVPQRPRRRHDPLRRRDAAAARGARRRCAGREAAARARRARRFAEQQRRHAADGRGGRRIRPARDARPQPHRGGRARDDAVARGRGRRRERADDRRAEHRRPAVRGRQ